MKLVSLIKIVLICAVLLSALFLLTDKTEVKAVGNQTSGKAIYQNYCIKCHAGNGTGTEYGRTLDVTDIRQMPVSRTRKALTNGVGQMPSFRKKLTKKQIDAVANYVKTL